MCLVSPICVHQDCIEAVQKNFLLFAFLNNAGCHFPHIFINGDVDYQHLLTRLQLNVPNRPIPRLSRPYKV